MLLEIIEFLQGLKFDDFHGERELSQRQLDYNAKMDSRIKFLSGYIKRPDRDNDDECINRACPVR